MKNILKDVFLFTILILYLFYILTNNYLITEQIRNIVNVWLVNIVPALFFTFVISDIINNSKIPFYFEKYFGINYLFVFSIIFGSPANAYILSDKEQDITKHLVLTKYTSLIFTYNYLNKIFNKSISIIIIIANILSNLILIVILKPDKLGNTNNNEKLLSLLPKSIGRAMNTLIIILGTCIFFNTLPVYFIHNIYLKTFVLSILEITGSFNNLMNINLNTYLKLLFALISVNTCGICIEMQIKSIIDNAKVNYKKYLLYRFLHFLLLFIISVILLLIFNA